MTDLLPRECPIVISVPRPLLCVRCHSANNAWDGGVDVCTIENWGKGG